MNNSIIKILADNAAEQQENKLFVLIAVVVFVLFAILLFIYLATCIVIVKQGTRKIVERFGSYNRTLKEGLHIIFRPFDKIAPVPWNILSISERDAFDRNMAKKRLPYYNDNAGREGRRLDHDLGLIESSRSRLLSQEIRNRLHNDVRMQFRQKILNGGFGTTINADGVMQPGAPVNLESAAFSDRINVRGLVRSSTGKDLDEIIDEILRAENSLAALESAYGEMGIDAYAADPELVHMLVERAHEVDALTASIKLYPRHQDPHSRRAGLYPMAENHIQDFVDLRERHIDTSNERVRKLFALKLDTNLHFPHVGESKDLGVLAGANRFSGVNLITKDNASIGANIVIFFSVTDPYLYYYGVDEPEESLVLLAITTLRNIVSGLTLEEALQARASINKQIREELDVACNNWGIKANRVEVKEFELGLSMQKAMDDVLIAEREKRANILRAEGYRKMKDEQVMAEHIKLRGYETLEEVSRGPANKVFIPNDLSDFITGAHVLADAFGEAKKAKAEPVEVIDPEDKKVNIGE